MIKIQIYGTGCPKCVQLAQHAETAAQALGLEYEVEKVTDINAIIGFGVLSTPALIVDGTIKVSGRVPTVAQLKEMLA